MRPNAIDFAIRSEQPHFVGEGSGLMALIVKLVQGVLGAKQVADTEVIGHVLNQLALSLDGLAYFVGYGSGRPSRRSLWLCQRNRG